MMRALRDLSRVGAGLGCMVLAATPSLAGPIPFTAKPVAIEARDQDIGTFLNQFFAAAGLPVVVSTELSGKVNGRFTGAPASVWANVSRAFNLVGYHDGATVAVYAAKDVQSRTVAVPAGRAQELASAIARAGLADDNNHVRVTSAQSLLATGVPKFVDQVQQLAAALPAAPGAGQGGIDRISPSRAAIAPVDAVEPYELRVFYLKYARADDTMLDAGGRETKVPGVGSTLSKIMGDGQPVAGSVTGQYGSRRIRQSQPRLMGRGLDAVDPDAAQASPTAPYDDEYLGLPPAQGNAVASAAAGANGRYVQSGPRISIDPSLNAVIVRDRPENMPAYEGLVKALDIAPQVVQLEATIIDLNIDKARELGINWRVQSQGFNALFGGDLTQRSGNAANDIANFGSANNGLSLSSVIGAHRELISRITALEQKGAARIVSRPQLVTLANVEAVFDRTQTFYVRVAGDRQVDLFNVTAGTVLRVNPHVLTENGAPRIRMVVAVQDGTILDNRVDRIPVVENASVNTQALINEGESLLLGGLTVNAKYDAESKIPIVGDIPVLGELFKSRSKSSSRIERLFLITPRVVRLDQVATAAAVTTTPLIPGAKP
ncbi:type III secretion protein C [Sphingomonas sp. NFR15]|nr:type III secretion protein C [Sphingomonas sp. NFR15]